ncbi:MAG: Maf family protein, partial [bacterium]|nr:Maf family protein [bacterium]
RDDQEAAIMLKKLSGKTHRVLTGLALLDSASGQMQTTVEETTVLFHSLEPQKIREYVSTGEPRDKAGAYAIQGRGESLVKEIRGDFNNVVGLPLKKLADLLSPWVL